MVYFVFQIYKDIINSCYIKLKAILYIKGTGNIRSHI